MPLDPVELKASLPAKDFEEFAENLMMHLLVHDVDAWWVHLQAQGIPEKYGVRADAPQDMSWGMRDLILVDPSGVLWRISQDLAGAGSS